MNNIDSRDIDLAIRLQRMLLPRLPKSQHWDIAYKVTASHGLCGDFIDIYDFTNVYFGEAPKENIGIVLLDASGHGLSAALVAAIARPVFFKAHQNYKNDPLSYAVFEANGELIQHLGGVSNYLTGLSIRLNNEELRYVNAAHPHILWLKQHQTKTYGLPNEGCFFGSDEFRSDLEERCIRPAPGDVFLLYTDGLKDAENANGKSFPLGSLGRLLPRHEMDAEKINQRLYHLLRNFGIDCDKPGDDLTTCVLVYKGC